MPSSCRIVIAAFTQQPIISTSTASSESDSAATHVAMKITAAARTVIRLSMLSARFVEVAVTTIVQTTIAAARMNSGRHLAIGIRGSSHPQDQQRQQHDRLAAEHELLRQTKRIRAAGNDGHRKDDHTDRHDDEDGALDHDRATV